jgi:hypothetical protein
LQLFGSSTGILDRYRPTAPEHCGASGTMGRGMDTLAGGVVLGTVPADYCNPGLPHQAGARAGWGFCRFWAPIGALPSYTPLSGEGNGNKPQSNRGKLSLLTVVLPGDGSYDSEGVSRPDEYPT